MKASGQTQSKWCATHDLNIHQFKYWLRKFNSCNLNESKNLSNSNWHLIDIGEQMRTRNSLSVKVGFEFFGAVIKILQMRDCLEQKTFIGLQGHYRFKTRKEN
ncbi:IS66 family insertion sequence element accessory protein TnpA [Neobacillus sp. M.A.Huq-85]